MDKRYHWAFFFLFVQIIAVTRNLLFDYNYFFWYCDFAPALFSIAFFIGNKNIIKGLVNFGLIPQIIFLIDFIYSVNIGESFLGITIHQLEFNLFLFLSTILVHLTTIAALLLVYKTKPNKKTLFYSAFFVLAIYLVTLIFTSPLDNINFVYSTKDIFKLLNFAIPDVVWFWPFLTFLIVVLPAHLIQHLLYRLSKKHILNLKPQKL
jgi:hypothetical protein